MKTTHDNGCPWNFGGGSDACTCGAIERAKPPSPQATPSEARGPSPSPSLDKLREAARRVSEEWGKWSALEELAPPDGFLDALDSLKAARPHPEEQGACGKPGAGYFGDIPLCSAHLEQRTDEFHAALSKVRPEEQGEATDLEALERAFIALLDGSETSTRLLEIFRAARSRTPSQGGANG